MVAVVVAAAVDVAAAAVIVAAAVVVAVAADIAAVAIGVTAENAVVAAATAASKPSPQPKISRPELRPAFLLIVTNIFLGEIAGLKCRSRLAGDKNFRHRATS